MRYGWKVWEPLIHFSGSLFTESLKHRMFFKLPISRPISTHWFQESVFESIFRDCNHQQYFRSAGLVQTPTPRRMSINIISGRWHPNLWAQYSLPSHTSHTYEDLSWWAHLPTDWHVAWALWDLASHKKHLLEADPNPACAQLSLLQALVNPLELYRAHLSCPPHWQPFRD